LKITYKCILSECVQKREREKRKLENGLCNLEKDKYIVIFDCLFDFGGVSEIFWSLKMSQLKSKKRKAPKPFPRERENEKINTKITKDFGETKKGKYYHFLL